MKKWLILSGLVLMTTTLAKPIVVGSKLDPEAQLLGQMILLTLQNAGLEVTDKTTLGDTGVNRKAILAGEIDVYPEYTGNAVYLFPDAKIDAASAGNPSKIHALAKQLDAKNGITWLKSANANNTWVVALPEAFAKTNKLTSLTDLAKYLNQGGSFKIAGSPEFFDRPDTMPAFEKAYGFKLKPAQKLVLAGATPPQTQQAAARGTSGVNAAMAYGTDGTLSALKLVSLSDPKGAQPVYQPAPIIRSDILKANPKIEGLLNKVFASLDQKTLQNLNGQIAVEGKNARDVAQAYLKSKNLIK
ncbi:ABC transporter substrate-binding protein [Deinococcus peraridilitoris]|uniref:Periplasmic glycine betaine/choline-binding (Lipo)protein of an ABC-type transport system (Osmoprotectant binding protein) n=1 Tax=Deinococcus peraridilitoris (strain DSM 19664 / LMG 22246 / CIP 109416 / KR-200) TaxID=937777 RepID=L0A3I2_DEIPD|nr:ABC transporter substrate-binding protein [Deinococcus peraridilitoris]AFZ68406.1 periplasmic glycine betaine/choline-binding (lipo)protein of an ABC-type transport system (osmoprotectant binding protein) [Deinococcus peraridilitoris DSM 19664]